MVRNIRVAKQYSQPPVPLRTSPTVEDYKSRNQSNVKDYVWYEVNICVISTISGSQSIDVVFVMQILTNPHLQLSSV